MDIVDFKVILNHAPKVRYFTIMDCGKKAKIERGWAVSCSVGKRGGKLVHIVPSDFSSIMNSANKSTDHETKGVIKRNIGGVTYL